MNSVRILHTADWHLGKEHSYLGAKGEQRKQEVLLTVKSIISLCEKENVDLLLVAGDLFESNHSAKLFADEVLASFAELTRTKVVIALGNHDPLTADSPFKNRVLPPNVFVFPENDSVFSFPELGCRVYGRSFSSVYSQGEERFFLTVPGDDKVNLLLLHGETKSDLSSPYFSVTKTFIEESKMDYIALGHNHKRSEIVRLGATRFAYCGCIEGQGYDEDGPKGVYLGDVAKNSVKLNFVPLAKRVYRTLNVDVTGVSSVTDTVVSAIKQSSENYSDDLFYINLVGETENADFINISEIKANAEPLVYALRIKDKTTVRVDLELLANENSLRGRFVREMLDMLESADEKDKTLYENALQIGLKSFEGQVNFGED